MPADPVSLLFGQAQLAMRQGRLPDALRLLDALLQRAPGHADGWNLAGIVRHMRREHDAAIHAFERALAAGGGAGVRVNLGFAQQRAGRVDEAERSYAAAAEQEPTLALAWQKLAGLQEAQGRREEALASYRRAVVLDPSDLKSLGDGLYLRRHLADWREADTLSPRRLLETFARAPRSDFSPGLLLSLPEATPEQHREAAAKFARSQWGGPLAAPPLAPAARAHAAPLRVGYLSADFCEHAVSYLVNEVIAAHDRRAVQVFVYAYRTPAPGDPWRRKAIAAADRFADLDAMDDDAAARSIRADGVDVLVDLTGYTGHSRPGIAARRPAPVIVNWIGYIGSLGEPRLADYIIGDAIATPPSVAPHFSEALARMPHCFQPNGRRGPLPPPPPRAAEGLPDEGVVFCSFNQAYKLNPPLWDDWCAILRGVPGSVLWLAQPQDALAGTHLREEAERRGVAGERIVLAQQRSRDDHLARLALADLALDTSPYNSGTTASDALRVGVPLLAVLGGSFVSRMAGSLLHAAGLPECVAPDRAHLVAMAIRLGNHRGALQGLRQRVASQVSASRLFDPQAFARDLERLYAAMHAQALAGRREAIDLAPLSAAPGVRPA